MLDPDGEGDEDDDNAEVLLLSIFVLFVLADSFVENTKFCYFCNSSWRFSFRLVLPFLAWSGFRTRFLKPCLSECPSECWASKYVVTLPALALFFPTWCQIHTHPQYRAKYGLVVSHTQTHTHTRTHTHARTHTHTQ